MNAPDERVAIAAAAPAELLRRLKDEVNQGDYDAIVRFRNRRDVDRLLIDLSRNVDRTLVDAWNCLELPRRWALVAVGGYGRMEMFPHSDVDLLLLLDAAASPDQLEPIERFLGLCWDMGLEIAHSVRTVAECLEQSELDVTVQTSLAEARLLTGDRALFDELAARFATRTDPKQFFSAKVFEQEQRHAKFHYTPYSLEPNCKESPGGLRDLQVVLWVSRVAGLGSSWRQLHENGLITRAESRALARHERVLRMFRAQLHLLTKRKEDRLVFDVQTALAETMGITAVGSRRPSEVLMQRYYWAAKAVTQLTMIVMQNIEERLFARESAPPTHIDSRFDNLNDLLDIREDDLFEREPSMIFEAFLMIARHAELKGMSTRTLHALWHARTRIDADFRRSPVNRRLFMDILKQPRGVVGALRRMNQTSVLGRYLPVFRRIIGQMQHDLFHVYTVDQHIMQVVRNLRRFTMAEHAHEYPFCSRLMASFDKPWILYVAALFHDIAKGRGGDHSQLGMADAQRFCRDHELDDTDTELVTFLVQRHLAMSHVAQKQDLSDPQTIQTFAELVGDERHLVALYLLTVADIRGTSPKVWNAWKATLLEDLFRLTRRVLGGAPASRHSELESRQEEARRILSLYAFSPTAHETLWKHLDVAFFLRQDAQTIAWLTRTLHYRVDSSRPIVKARLAQMGDGLQIAVYSRDEPDLFTRICGYFDSCRFSVLDAKIHTTDHGYALDTFLVATTTMPDGEPPDYQALAPRVETQLAERISDETALVPPPRSRVSRQTRHFPIQPTVSLTPDDRGEYHLLSLTAADRSGLLYDVASILRRYQVNVHTAKVMTLGERVEDVFLVGGAALGNARTQIRLESELLEALTVR
ncbi:[protein-PII] uridylyltransferase [soil metagenome]